MRELQTFFQFIPRPRSGPYTPLIAEERPAIIVCQYIGVVLINLSITGIITDHTLCKTISNPVIIVIVCDMIDRLVTDLLN